MKKLLLTVAILATILVMSCEDSPKAEVNPFVGTWECENNHFRYVFTNNYVTGTLISNETDELSGAYTYDDEKIYITTDFRIPALAMQPQPLVYEYEIIDNSTIVIAISRFTRVSN